MPTNKGQLTNSSNPNWRGGRSIASNGYVLIRMPNHPLADTRGYVYEHRLVAEQMIGRPLLAHEQIHHKDGNKQNNHPDNLQIMPSPFHHRAMHRTTGFMRRNPGEDNPLMTCACGCGTQFSMYDEGGRPRMYVPGHNMQRNPGDNPIVECACGCGTQFNKYSPQGRLRTFAPGHSKRCKPREANSLIECACGCGTQFNKYDSSRRPRKFVNGHNARRSQDVR
jgi:hypothetical protein